MTTINETAVREHAQDAAQASASWVDAEVLLPFLKGLHDGDPEWADRVPNPLSGEWADGLTLRQLAEIAEIDDEDDAYAQATDDAAEAYEQAFSEAYEEALHKGLDEDQLAEYSAWCEEQHG